MRALQGLLSAICTLPVDPGDATLAVLGAHDCGLGEPLLLAKLDFPMVIGAGTEEVTLWPLAPPRAT